MYDVSHDKVQPLLQEAVRSCRIPHPCLKAVYEVQPTLEAVVEFHTISY